MKGVYLALLLSVSVLALLPTMHASYILTGLNTTVVLNQNSSAAVKEVLKVAVTNQSVAQYSQDRLALNLTLSKWQSLIGPSLVEHIINPSGSIYDFNFLPGPLVDSNNGKVAYLTLSYYVTNVTKVNQTGPRLLQYIFDDRVFNFEHAASGEVLGGNTTLTIILPSGSRILSVYPPPDSPSSAFVSNYRNVTSLSWYSDEPLSQFTLSYDVQQSLQSEVLSFFAQAYGYLGGFAYVIIAAAVALFVAYVYLKASRSGAGAGIAKKARKR